MQKLSTSMNDGDEEDDDDDDLDDVDLDEDDDLDPSIDDSMDWEFETQDGSLIIAEENNSTPQTKKKTKKPTSVKKAKMKSTNSAIDSTQNGYAKAVPVSFVFSFSLWFVPKLFRNSYYIYEKI